ncbi:MULTISPECIES: hypothetical protein [Sphingobacterium]|uniref:Uncharacterized protein n=1 Tax=Sphingobacterium kitahiroshimense TaxID=470446 RepID=A0ABV0C035_9SPHI|nr:MULTISPECIES: hypothetical protein [Sphingobacterium]MCS3556104.1 hypothetical protein [Sphingobacterium sp. JUb21]MCW2263536.1 hypothetical protein [Sphingobacterium kitahiroshimense]NJI74379.1 hypothetical protein [Sphingobacterium sp. B16(2022)]QQD14176.1 hypothetical protein JAZ75_01110 [Sphingobacterium sp. UDSM-2020]TCR05970.1 hypothetical protein EDF67_109106 [Sphingobacterium sp. JUb78]
MKKNKRVWLIIIPILAILAFMLKDSLTQKSIEDLPGEFKEVAFVRNEQNKGGIIRIYAISVGKPDEADYKACIDLLPVNDYGSSTTAYFFDKNTPYPTSLTIEAPHYDGKKFQAIQISKKSGMDKK